MAQTRHAGQARDASAKCRPHVRISPASMNSGTAIQCEAVGAVSMFCARICVSEEPVGTSSQGAKRSAEAIGMPRAIGPSGTSRKTVRIIRVSGWGRADARVDKAGIRWRGLPGWIPRRAAGQHDDVDHGQDALATEAYSAAVVNTARHIPVTGLYGAHADHGLYPTALPSAKASATTGRTYDTRRAVGRSGRPVVTPMWWPTAVIAQAITAPRKISQTERLGRTPRLTH